jgi:adenine-specific DNA-methyltransferase
MTITYMGTKRELASAVASVLNRTKDGLLLDAFAGMGAIASTVANRRPVWTNDVQHFSYLVGKCLFASTKNPLSASSYAAVVEEQFSAQLNALRRRHADLIEASDRSVRVKSLSEFISLVDQCNAVCEAMEEGPYECFLKRYSNSYFSAGQTVEIDALRYSLDYSLKVGRLSREQFDWGIVTLGRALLKVANTPGHFAQFLRPNERSLRRIQRQARRSVWAEWLISVEDIRPVGTAGWRRKNRATRSDSLELLQRKDQRPSISTVYCDPPYTDDQYSRFYHVWETLVLYDAPNVTGTGRYRPDRFTTPFSKKTTVVDAFDCLVRSVRELGSDFVLSYPTNGLLYEAGAEPMDMLAKHYKTAKMVFDINHKHSTFGASKGVSKSEVREMIYLATQ